ncbi:SdrD B-like domain-containing protein [Spirosoma aerolatum]|uniref:SdrD B-like domain-containing protein n=1 Tax=Spirosoma aerolatum TaxID=1211326 RepID=UPI0009AC9F82|nr:SdrD B-like domain-containing protein [Spirosoma aerolatum]
MLRALSVLAFLLLGMAALPAQAQTQKINLSLHKSINSQSPAIGDVVTYTIVVANASGFATATNVSVKDELPAGGVSFIPGSATVTHGTGTFTPTGSLTATTGTWSIPSIASGDSAVLVMKATVLERGVWFNTAEVIGADQTDLNSIPGNQSLAEDDYDAVCFSVPILWYVGDEYTVTIPSGYDQIVWYRDNVPVSSTAVSTSLAEVNSDSSLTIKSPGTYRFVTYRNGCPSSNCCDIQVIQGPYGSLGDYVWLDTNQDGKQDNSETGIDSVKVYLYDNTGTVKLDSTITAGGGKYLFDSLTDGSYIVRFIAPSGYQSTSVNAAGVTDDLDSDAGLNGFTGIYTIDTSQPESSTARNNPTVDAGFYIPSAGLGDFVWNDTNKNGIQDDGEPPIQGVTAVLYINGVASATTVTNASGLYSFTGLTPGSSTSYAVGFTTPSGFTATLPYSGTDRTKDSNADLITGMTESVTLAPGEFNSTLDAGFYIPSAGLGDFVWNDINKNGIQDDGEPPIQGVTAVLYINGVASATTVTNASGLYSFTGLTPGSSTSYAVGFTTPSGFTATLPYSGTDRTKDSNADLITGMTESVTLAPGEFNSTLDAGFYIPSAGLGDFVWVDLNKDGIQDGNEPGIQGVTVTLYVNGLSTGTTVTNSSGFYSFTGLTPGSSLSYSVGFTTPSGYTATIPLSGSDKAFDSDADLITGITASVTLAPGEFNLTLDAGYIPPVQEVVKASLGDFVWNDVNKDGIQDDNESGIPDVVVTLYTNGVVSATTVTNSSGFYSFTGLTPGNSLSYSVGFTTPSGYTATLAQQGGNDEKDSDADVITGKTRSVTLAPGENNLNLDAGFYVPSAGLGDFVWNDTNHNGIQDDGEPPIQGVTAVLYINGVASATTVTNASGLYSFTGLTPGSSTSYVVGFTAPSGFTASVPYSGTDRTKDSNADLITGMTESVTLAPGEFNSTLDAGFYIPSAGLGDFVWNDTNKNGIQDDDEPGIASVTVTLYVNGVASATTVTNASGFYSFTGLTPGNSTSYAVGFTAPSGYTATLAQQGGNDTKDSDADAITGKTRSVTLAPGEFNGNLDAGYYTCPVNFSLIASNDLSICNGDVAILTATSSVTAAQIRWYLTPYDGVAFATTSNGASLTVNPTTTTIYYAEAFTADGCVSARKPVAVQVTTVPTPVCLGIMKNTCPQSTVDLTQIHIENHANGLTYEWYTSIERLAETRVTNLTAVGAGKYYLFAKQNNCYSTPTVLNVEIVDCSCQNPASVTAVALASVCEGDPISLRAILGGSATSVTWSATTTGGMFSAPGSLTTTYTPSATDVAAGNVLLTVTTNDPDGEGICAPASYAVLVKINKRPDAPLGVACDDTLVCQGSSTKLVGFAPNGRINWYDQNGTLIGTTVSGGKLTVTPAKAGDAIYYAETISSEGCVSSTRSSLTITVGQCLADLAVVKDVVTAGPFSVGQKITYSLTASNNGPITGTDVKVTDLLPGTLTYVSSTPVNQYNPATGIWTIGTLTPGSSRVLLIEATINAGGSLKNTAIISGANNDPNHALNDTSRTVTPIIDCNVAPPTLICAISQICKGNTTTLSAKGCENGTVRWSNGSTGTTIFAAPTATTTYTASCVIGQCVSQASAPITVTVVEPQTPVIVASADNVCPGTSVTLTASGCQGGIIEWSDKAQTGNSIVVTPYSKTTYTAQCRQGSCLSNPAVITININADQPQPTIVCSTSVVCPGETVTLTVDNCIGTPHWNSTTATTSSIVVTPTLGSNTYWVYCQSGSCTSKSSPTYTIQVVAPVIPTVTASADTVCAGGAITLTAADCNGTVMWSNGETGTSITVHPTANISYYAQCKYRTCLSNPSNTVSVAVVNPQAPIVRLSSTSVCSGEPVSLTATGCTGTVVWHGVDKTGSIITIYPTESKQYYATCKIGSCESSASNSVRISVNTSPAPAPTVVASTTAICSGGLVSLTATGCDGTVKWSDGQTGAVVSVSVTPSNHEFYALCIPASGSACGSGKSNVVNIQVTPTPTPSIVRCLCSADTICPGEEVKLSVKNCQGTPYWSTGETTTSIIVSPTVTTGYTVYCQDGVCQSTTTQPYTITVIPVTAPTIVASTTNVTPGGSVTLTASGCTGTVIWSANDVNGNNKGASIVVIPNGTQTYYAQCQYHACLSDPSNPVIINPGDCVVKAGSLTPVNDKVCASTSTTAVVAATPNGGLIQPTSYSVVYVLAKDGLVQQTGAAPQFTVDASNAHYTIHTLVYNANSGDANYLDLSQVKPNLSTIADVQQLIGSKCASLDATGAAIKVCVIDAPTLSATSLTVCSGGPVSITATGCENGTVKWSDGKEGAVYTTSVYAETWLTAICEIDHCASKPSATVHISLGTPPIPIIVSNKSALCVGETVSLTATGCSDGNYQWSDAQQTIGSILTVTPTQDVTFRVKCKVGSCEGEWSAATTIQVGKPSAPTISILGGGSNATVCFGASVTLVAQGCSPDSYVTWSNNQVGNTLVVSPASSTTFSAQCCNSTYCKSDASNTVGVNVLPKVPVPTVSDLTNTCPITTADLSKGVTSNPATTGGVFEYYTDATLSTKVADPAHVGTGVYYVIEKTTNGCVSLPVAIHVQVTTCMEPSPCDGVNPATASAGADASVCAAKTYQLSGTMGGSGNTAHWTTSGTGTFDNPYALNAVYTASAADLQAGKVTLTLTVTPTNPNCPVATDAMDLTINGVKDVPVVTVVGAQNLCYGDSVTLKAPAGYTGYKWSNGATSETIIVKHSGTYSVQLVDGSGCSSVSSEPVMVNVAEPVLPPLVHNLRNECPSKIVDLTKALSTTTAGSTYTYRICECNTSNIVIRPDSVCEGTYWVVERTAQGCVSKPSKVVVKVFNCAADTLNTDVSIAKLASTAFVQNGAPVTYTITVSNAGPHTAYNVDVRDVLPKGLELIPTPGSSFTISNGSMIMPDAGGSFTVSNGVVSKHIDSLKTGASTQIVFNARLTVKNQEVVNTAEIVYLDNKETNLANNTSSVTVKDTSAHKASVIGLAKSVLGTPQAIGDSLVKVAYKFVVTNFGEDTLRSVQVNDDLAYAFRPNTVSASVTLSDAASTLKVNSEFTGSGSHTNLLDSASYILPGKSQIMVLDVTVKRVAGDTTKAFYNLAGSSAVSSNGTVTDMSTDGGVADPDNDGDPTNNTVVTSFTLGTGQPQGPSIGLALAVVKVEQQPDSSYNVTYKATIKNFGDVELKGLSLTDSLNKVFISPASYSVVGGPVVGAGSTLVANTGFDGSSQPDLLTNASKLAAGAQDTVVFVVNVKTNGNNGPFYSSATVTGTTPDASQTVMDISNNGFDPAPQGSTLTTVRFDLPKGLLGVAKEVGTPTLVQNGVYDIPYTITLTNMGTEPLKTVQVEDNLSTAFGKGALIVSNQIHVASTGTVTVDTLYTGQGMITKMLVDTASTLAVGAKATLTFTVRVDVSGVNPDSLTFYNTALASAKTSSDELVDDASTAGTNNDPDNDLDPRNNSQPTPIVLNGRATDSHIGLAMTVADTVRQSDGSYNVTYQIVVKAYGPDPLTNVTISDTLSKVFNTQTGSIFTLVKAPFITSTGSALKLNPNYNGVSDPVIVLGDSTSALAVGKVDTIRMVINVIADGSTTTFLNTAYATAQSKTGLVSDISTSGLNPDLNGNGDPTDPNEREATPLTLLPTYQEIFIPQGFSPNGDGINDRFVIRGANGLTVSLEVYNRWGNLVYKNEDYQNDWDGKPNTGIVLSSADSNGVPDGTYYYVVNLSDGRKFVRYMTINR